MSNIILKIGKILLYVIDAYRFILIIYFLMTWLPGATQSSLGRIIYQLVDPYISFFRQFVPPIGYISFAGILALLVLQLIRSGLNTLIIMLASMF